MTNAIKPITNVSVIDTKSIIPECPPHALYDVPADQVAQRWVNEVVATRGGPTNYIFPKDEMPVAWIGHRNPAEKQGCTVSEPSRLTHMLSSLVARVTGQPIPPLLATLNCTADGHQSTATFDNNKRVTMFDEPSFIQRKLPGLYLILN